VTDGADVVARAVADLIKQVIEIRVPRIWIEDLLVEVDDLFGVGRGRLPHRDE
jgi:hypothetical protein